MYTALRYILSVQQLHTIAVWHGGKYAALQFYVLGSIPRRTILFFYLIFSMIKFTLHFIGLLFLTFSLYYATYSAERVL